MRESQTTSRSEMVQSPSWPQSSNVLVPPNLQFKQQRAWDAKRDSSGTMSHHYSSVRGWDFPEASSTCWDIGATAFANSSVATLASVSKLIYESRHADFHTWAFVLVPSVVQ